MSEAVHIEQDGPTARITVGTGHRANALDDAAWRALADGVAELGARESLRAVVIGGRDDTFCAGSDMTGWLGADVAAVGGSFAGMEAAFLAVEECPVPVVAAITGVAAGAGCQLALACDLRVMGTSARIGMPIVRLGILPSPAFAARIIELAGPSVARELLYTGRLLRAADAHAVGLADRCVPDADLPATVTELTERIAAQPPTAIRAAKRAVAAVLRPGRASTEGTDPRTVSEGDFHEAIENFLHRR